MNTNEIIGIYGYIYKITNLINNKIYIGQHKYQNSELDENYFGSGIILNKAMEKYGKENFEREILELCSTKPELNVRETAWINYYNSTNLDIGYNIALGGQGGDIFNCLSDDAKEKAIIKCKETKLKNNTLINPKFTTKGLEMSEETKLKISNSHKNLKASDETKLKMSLSRKNHLVSDETKNKISQSEKGKIVTEETRAKLRKPKSLEHRQHLAMARLGISPWNKGLKLGPSHNKNKICVNKDGKNKFIEKEALDSYLDQGYAVGNTKNGIKHTYVSKGNKGMHWYTNGEVQVQAYSCPDGFMPGRLKSNK